LQQLDEARLSPAAKDKIRKEIAKYRPLDNVTAVEVVNEHQCLVRFNDGSQQVVDLKNMDEQKRFTFLRRIGWFIAKTLPSATVMGGYWLIQNYNKATEFLAHYIEKIPVIGQIPFLSKIVAHMFTASFVADTVDLGKAVVRNAYENPDLAVKMAKGEHDPLWTGGDPNAEAAFRNDNKLGGVSDSVTFTLGLGLSNSHDCRSMTLFDYDCRSTVFDRHSHGL
jgi:hypothetical protein